MKDIHYQSPKRITSQQQVVFEVVKKSNQHLTADAIYKEARKSQPRISLATVYRNLDKLADSSVIGKVTIQGISYYELHTEPHYHVICLSCRSVSDVDSPPAADIEDYFKRSTPYALTNHDLTLYGICPTCQKRR